MILGSLGISGLDRKWNPAETENFTRSVSPNSYADHLFMLLLHLLSANRSGIEANGDN